MLKEVLRIENLRIANNNARIKDIHINIFRQEITGALFDNINEKQLFVSIFEQEETIENGLFYLHEKEILKRSWFKTANKNITVVGKDSTLIDAFEIAENLFFHNDSSKLFFKKNLYRSLTKELFAKFSIQISPKQSIEDLSFFEKILLEILKAYILKHSVVLLYQLTYKISQENWERLLELLRLMKEEGMSFMIVDSYKENIIQYAERFFYMSKGRTVGTYLPNKWNQETFKSAFLSSNHKLPRPETLPNTQMPPTLEFVNITTSSLHHLSFAIRPKEFVVLNCKNNHSCENISLLLNGDFLPETGSIIFEQEKLSTLAKLKKLKSKIGIINENALDNMLVKEIPLIDNIMLSLIKKIPYNQPYGRYKQFVINTLKDLISPEDLLKTTGDLSLETQLKAIYYKWLLFNPKVVVCIRPFALDVNQAPELIRKMILNLINRGIAVLLITTKESYVDEIDGKRIDVENFYSPK